MSRYAENTTVPVHRSKAEIERIIMRYGAKDYMSGTKGSTGEALVGFTMNDRQVRFRLVLPKVEDFKKTPKGRIRHDGEAVGKAHEQACRQAWRALALVVKAKFEAVETGITTFEEEFLANIVVPGGKTIGETIIPRLDYDAASLPKLLPEAGT